MLFYSELELAVYRFQIISDCIHITIFAQFMPVFKGVFGNFLRICFICFDITEGIVLIFFQQQRIHRTDLISLFMKYVRNRFAVSSCMLHDNPNIAVKLG